MTRPQVTRRDVAHRAGTSVAVVSYVINDGPRNVKPETKERVLAAIKELGYRANAAARSLRTRRTMAIGLVVPDASSPFYGALAREIEDEAFAAGYALLLGNAMEDKAREAAYVRTLLGRQVDGLIVAPSSGYNSWLEDVARSATTSIIIDRDVQGVPITSVTVNNRDGALAAVRHLISHGRVRIACIAGPRGVHPTEDRVDGWHRALAEGNLLADACPVTYGTFLQSDGFSKGMQLLSRGFRPDAIFTTSDEQAIGVLSAASQLGIRVPDELSVMGFDGLRNGQFCIPPLSTVEQPLRLLAQSAVRRVIDARPIEPRSPERIEMTTRLVLRRSCGCDFAMQADGESVN